MSLQETVEQIVADFERRPLPQPTPRAVDLPGLPGKVDAVIGFRRVGKTWFLYQRIRELLAAGVDRSRILYVDLEDERLSGMEVHDLQLLSDVFFRRNPDARREGAYFFLDEIQNVPQWERFVRRIVGSESVQVVVSGSSAKLLSREIATSLRGRSLATELLPFSFQEVLRHRGLEIPTTWPPSAELRSRLEKAFGEYLTVGGFPEVQGLSPDLRRRVLQEYVDVALFRDVVERHGATNLPALRYLVRRFLAAPAGRFSVNRFYNDLKSQGLRVGKDTVHDYVAHLEDAYLLAAVEISSGSVQVRRTNPRKAYPIDPGLARAMSISAGEDIGHLLETIVYLELRRRRHDCAYLMTENGHEVDFIARSPDGTSRLVQVSADLTDARTRDRELRALSEAMEETGMNAAQIVTMHQTETIELEPGTVRVVPAWRWVLEDNLHPSQ